MQHTRKAVQAALEAEAALDVTLRGTHQFNPIQRTLRTPCNWTATFVMIGSPIPLAAIHDALERVQARMPIVDFGP